MESNELQHWGIPGMKWGVRRYQNKDGTLTTEGRERYASKLEGYREKELKKIDERRKSINSRGPAKFGQISKKTLNNFLDKETESLKNMSYDDLSKEKQKYGKAKVNTMIEQIGHLGLKSAYGYEGNEKSRIYQEINRGGQNRNEFNPNASLSIDSNAGGNFYDIEKTYDRVGRSK